MRASPSIVESMRYFFDRRSAADVSVFDDLMSSEHVVFLGSEGNEWFEDRERMRRAFGFEGTRIEPSPDACGWEEGTIGWYVDRPLMTLPGLGTLQTRCTFVLRREADRWKVVQGHFSVGVPDAVAVAEQPAWVG